MTTPERYPAGVPCWVDTLQTDTDAARAFYAGVFGWEFSGPGPMPDGGGYYVAQVGGRDVAGVASVPPQNPDVPPAWTTYVAVDDVDAAAAAVTAHGGTVIVAPFDAAPAGRGAVFIDPRGAALGLWQAQDRIGAGRINEPSAWAMSVLRTDEVDAAAAFYHAVFGWERLGFEGIDLFQVPGYVGGTESQPVPRDVVAAMVPVAAGVPPHWGVDFWIADAAAGAAAAERLGGSVLQAAHADPPFQRAQLADPAGARFTISQLQAY